MDEFFERMDPAERLIAEHAVLAHREVMKAVNAAPHGRGLEMTELAVLGQGRKQMMLMMEEALKAKAGAQKGGSRANAADKPRSATTRRSS